MFLHLSVCQRVGGGGWGSWGGGGVLSRPRPKGEVVGSGREGCPGLHPGARAVQAYTGGVSRPTSGGVHVHAGGRGRGVQAQAWGGGVQAQARRGVFQHALRQTPPPQQTVTAAGGTHPTGMYSCIFPRSLYSLITSRI